MKTLQGHLTNTKQSHVDSDVAQVSASSQKDVLNFVNTNVARDIMRYASCVMCIMLSLGV